MPLQMNIDVATASILLLLPFIILKSLVSELKVVYIVVVELQNLSYLVVYCVYICKYCIF